jgi:glyoxylase-like metal-dependent hydrolase (beta-lactamase superfamily II)
MKIHHLNCGTMRPVGGRLLNRSPARAVCHCLLIESSDELVLIDSGVGVADFEAPSRLGPMRILLNLRREPGDAAVRQLRRLGYRDDDVKHIVVTHLDLDHAGGLPDFPSATVHVYGPEYQALTQPRGYRERERYRPVHFAHQPRWQIHERLSSEPWFGLPCIREPEGLPPEIVLVPLTGHTRGHCGVAVERPDGWILHAGDAYYHRQQMAASPHCPPGFKLFQYLAHMDRKAASAQEQRIREAVRAGAGRVQVVCTHDPDEFERSSGTEVD